MVNKTDAIEIITYAENQVLFHLCYEHDENDVHDVKLLCEGFNIPVPSEYK